ATLPAERRARLLAAWRQEGARDQPLLEADTAKSLPYPLVTHATRELRRDLRLASDVHVAMRTVELDVRHGAANENIAKELVDAAARGARVAWIRNSVAEAQMAYAQVECAADRLGVATSVFHARFRGCDRRCVESAVLGDFGKERK